MKRTALFSTRVGTHTHHYTVSHNSFAGVLVKLRDLDVHFVSWYEVYAEVVTYRGFGKFLINRNNQRRKHVLLIGIQIGIVMCSK